MNLLTKLKNYLHLKRNNINNAYRKSFDYPLTDSDKYALVMTVCLLMIYVVLKFKDEIDASEQREIVARQQLAKVKKEKEHIEIVMVSTLNGGYVENGKKVTMCRLNAAGECK